MEPNFHVYKNLLLNPFLSHVNSANMVLLSALHYLMEFPVGYNNCHSISDYCV